MMNSCNFVVRRRHACRALIQPDECTLKFMSPRGDSRTRFPRSLGVGVRVREAGKIDARR
jgi:hypothetical protein